MVLYYVTSCHDSNSVPLWIDNEIYIVPSSKNLLWGLLKYILYHVGLT